MTRTEKLIRKIIAERLGVKIDKVIPQASLVEDLGADSLDEVELIMAFEDELDLEIPDHEAEKLKTVNDVVKYVEEKT